MSVCFVVTPVVAVVGIAGWPLLTAAIVGAGAALGYHAAGRAENALDLCQPGNAQSDTLRTVQMTMTDSSVMDETMSRGETFVLERGDVKALFKLDGRGVCTAHVSGAEKTDNELREIGQELMDRVRQQFAYAKVMAELEERGFEVVAQEVEANQSIRIRVRRWN